MSDKLIIYVLASSVSLYLSLFVRSDDDSKETTDFVSIFIFFSHSPVA